MLCVEIPCTLPNRNGGFEMTNFFGFDTAMPPLEEFPEELEEEEYDVLNDETFGSGAIDEWNAQTEKDDKCDTSKEIITNKKQSQSKTSPNDSGFASAEQLLFQEDELEQSVNQLVLDEELDDPAIMSSARRNQTTSVAYIRASSPAAPFSEDLLSPATNIWGSPARTKATKEDELKALLGIGRNMNDAQLQDSAIMSAIPSRQKQIVTAEELEKDLRSRAPPARSISPVIGSPPASSMMPIGTPPRHHYMQMSPAPVMPIHTPPQMLPSPMQQNFHQLTQQILQKTGGNGNPQQINHMIHNMYRNSGRVSPTPIVNAILASLAQGQMSPRPGFTRPPYHHLQQQARFASSPMSMPGRGGSTHHQHSGMMGSPHQHSPHQHNAFRHGGDGYNRNYNQQNFRSPNQYGQFNRNNRQQYNRGNRNDFRGYQNSPNGVRDEYANLMTQKEKDWVLRIQMLQLQSEDPMTEDFYYQMFLRKKEKKEEHVEGIQSEGKERKPKALLPPPKLEIREYKPMQFTGALGKLTSVSVNNPRKIIDIDMGNSVDEDEESKAKTVIHSNKQQKALLMKIERLYILMLSIKDLKRQMDEAREETNLQDLQGKCTALQHKLFSGLHIEQLEDRTPDDQFVNVLSVRKGRKLIGRSLGVLESHHAYLAVEAVFKNLNILIKRELQDAKKEVHEETLPVLYPTVLRVIQSADLSQLSSFVGQVVSNETESNKSPNNAVSLSLQHKFGSSIILILINRAEHIYTNTSLIDIDNSTQKVWTTLVTSLASMICAIDTTIAPPYEPIPDVLQHFGRFVSKQSYIALERRLGSLESV